MPKLNLDNPLFRAMGKLGDLFLLNLLWMLCCLPVVTVGASSTALFYVARKIAAGEDYLLREDFFHSFRQNFRQATAAWLALAAAGVLFLFSLWSAFHTPGAAGNVFRGTSIALCLLWLIVAGNAFALLARYEYSAARLLTDALIFGVTHPVSGASAIGAALWLPLLAWADAAAALYLFLPWMMVCGAASAVLLSAAQLPGFRKIEARREEAFRNAAE